MTKFSSDPAHVAAARRKHHLSPVDEQRTTAALYGNDAGAPSPTTTFAYHEVDGVSTALDTAICNAVRSAAQVAGLPIPSVRYFDAGVGPDGAWTFRLGTDVNALAFNDYPAATVWVRVGRPVADTLASALHEVGHLRSWNAPDRERTADAWRDHLAEKTQLGRPSSWFQDSRNLANAAEDRRIESNRAWVADQRQRASTRAAVIAAEIIVVEAEIKALSRIRDGAKRKAAEARLAALNEERLAVAGMFRSLPS